MRVLFDKNVPVAVRGFITGHQVSTIPQLGWPIRIKNGDLIKAAETACFDVMVTADQNIKYQQNLDDRKLSLVVLGSNVWPIVRKHEASIALEVNRATPGSYAFIRMPLMPKPQWAGKG